MLNTKNEANKDNDPEMNLVVYPNPSESDLVNIQFQLSNPRGSANMKLVDITGKIIRVMDGLEQNNNSNLTLNVSNLERGIYFVQLNQGGNQVTERIIIN